MTRKMVCGHAQPHQRRPANVVRKKIPTKSKISKNGIKYNSCILNRVPNKCSSPRSKESKKRCVPSIVIKGKLSNTTAAIA